MRDAKIVRLFLSGIVLALAACSSVGAATAPVVTFTSPQFGQSFSFGATVTCRFTVTVSAGTILRVVVTNNHGTPDTLRQTPYTRSYSNLIPGYYVIEARVTTADTTVIAQQPFVIKPKAYPALPASPAANGKVKIFILAGQSNMVGMGELHGAAGARGTMDYYVKAGSYGFLVDSLGKPTKRNDVWVVNQSYAVKQGWLTAGWGSDSLRMGPEYAFGMVMGDYFKDPVVLIKTAWGGRSLCVNFLPPSSRTYKTPVADGDTGYQYQQMIAITKKVVANLATYFPGYNGKGYEIMGLGWHQGWNDLIAGECVNAYEANIVNLIKDMRRDLGIKDLTFALANSGFSGWDYYGYSADQKARHLGIVNAQIAVADYTKHPEFKNTTGAAETRGFLRGRLISPSAQGYHWWRNFETYYLIGESIARAMIPVLPFNRPASVTRSAGEKPRAELTLGITEKSVMFVLNEPGLYDLALFNLSGRMIKTFHGKGIRGVNRIPGGMQSLPDGVLLLRLSSAGRLVAEKKVGWVK